MSTMKNSLAGGLLAVAALAAGIGGMSYSPSVEAQAVSGRLCSMVGEHVDNIAQAREWLTAAGCKRGDAIDTGAYLTGYLCSFNHPMTRWDLGLDNHWVSCVYRGAPREVIQPR